MNTLYIINLCVLFIKLKSAQAVGLPSYPCVYNGIKYEDGDRIETDDNITNVNLEGQCILCRCHQGVIMCDNELCSQLQCDTPGMRQSWCCSQCPTKSSDILASERWYDHEQRQESPTALMFTQIKQTKLREKKICISGGKQYAEGSKWQPIMGPLGMMACVECICMKNGIACNRFKCKDLPCSHPKKKYGECCPVCPTQGEVSTYGQRICLLKSSEVFVYRTENVSDTANRIEYGFLVNKLPHVVHLHTWDFRISGGQNMLQVETINKKKLTSIQLTLIGSTSYKHMNRFSRREQRLKGKCLFNCAEKVLLLETTLKLFPPTRRTYCHDDEMEEQFI